MYETIAFYENTSNAKRKMEGIRVGNYLAVTNISFIEKKYKIFRVKEGMPLLNAFFKDGEEAIKFATYIDQQFSDYFPIWQEYPTADLFNLVKWTVPNGIQWYETMKLLRKKKELTLEDISAAYRIAEEHVPNWFSFGSS